MDDNAIHLNVNQWYAWSPGIESSDDWEAWARKQRMPLESGVPELPFVKPMLRRRLSQLSKMAVKVAFECLSKEGQQVVADRTVFCSRHGELTRTVGLLESLSLDEDLSPTGFSLSVHNAASGLYSIANKDKSPSVSLAAGRDTLVEGLREASMLLNSDDAETVLVVIAEEPLPEHLLPFADEMQRSFALALLLARGDNTGKRLSFSSFDSPVEVLTERAGLPEPQSLAVLNFLLSQETECKIPGARSSWVWRQNA
ncbi:hypothetical protein A9Q99_16090 [Gammaproteobacteria bacterium 45_16_T64]|nr:hypothetical protein A9Q99_16090 [Gammaproteobacteria bacterium 45_16_T64]